MRLPRLDTALAKSAFWLIVAGGTALIIAGAELYVRYVVRLAPAINFFNNVTPEEARATFESDPELLWRFKPNLTLADDRAGPFRGVISNGQWFRQPDDIPREKAPNEVRLLFLGASATFGWGVLHDETFVKQIERDLIARYPGLVIRCLNAGVPGYSLYQGWRLLEKRGIGHQPDLIVLSFGPNDQASWGGIGDFEQARRWRQQQPPEWLAWSQLALFFTMARPEDFADVGPRRPRLRLAEFRDLLGRVRDISKNHDAELLAIVPVQIKNIDANRTRPGPYQLELAEFGRSLHLGMSKTPALVEGIAVFDRMLDEHRPEDLFIDAVHPTPFGHSVLAAALVAQIAPWIERQIEFGRWSSDTAQR